MVSYAIIALAAAGVPGLPSSRPPPPSYIIPSNRTITPYKEPSAFRTAVAAPERTDIEVGGGDVVAQDLNAGPGQSPQAFAQLLDYLASDLCTELGCNFGEEYCVTASTGADVCITAQGSFERAARDQFIRSTRGSFDRTVRRLEPGQGSIETGSNLVHFQSREGDLGVGDIRVQIFNKANEGGGAGCPAVISMIAAGGALFPQVATPFGVLSFLCGTADSSTGEASG
ncbi:Hypothetical protein D9617_28g064830 [Elsinoe fawcettii]|nr:Hypothetical protein D9617_28g064830 [Elsinoe fawcettii]